jgi:hypothetical protein
MPTGQLRRVGRLSALCVAMLLSADVAVAGQTSKYCSDKADNVVVYIDRTTPYDDIDKKDLIDGVSRLFETLKGGDRFSIRTIADNFAASTNLLDECLPVCHAGGLFGDLFSGCTEGVVINDTKHLRQAVVQQLKDILTNFVELPNSEIIRTLGLSAPSELRPGRPNRFYIFTDLIENSQYLPGKEFLTTKNSVLLKRIAKDGLVPDLHGAAVGVFGVGRSGNAGDRRPLDQALLEKLLDFWQHYFGAAGATVTIQQALGAVE